MPYYWEQNAPFLCLIPLWLILSRLYFPFNSGEPVVSLRSFLPCSPPSPTRLKFTAMATITRVRTQTETVLPKSLSVKANQITVDEFSTVNASDIPLPPPSKIPTEILSQDKGTPDSHVPRDPRLIRLTGVHPFNVEPPLTALFNEGMDCLFGPLNLPHRQGSRLTIHIQAS